jgi:hypothetical protein
MAKSLKAVSHKASATSRKEYLTKVVGSVLSQTTKPYGISSGSKKRSSSVKVSLTMNASSASKVLRDGRFGAEKKSIAGSVLAKSKTRSVKCNHNKKK